MATTVTLKPNAIDISGSTSGTTTLQASAVAGATTVTLPATTGTVITTGDTGTVTNTMLAGSITNAKLTNSSVTIGGTSIALGASSSTITNDLSISGLTVGKGGGSVSTNTAVGASALNANTTGGLSVAIGTSALAANTTSDANTAVGYQAASTQTTGALYTTAFGYQSLKANTSGTQNNGFGFQSLTANTTGANNSGFGTYALAGNTTGGSNTAFGNEAMRSNTTASNNTAVGYQAGYSNTTGINNTVVGSLAGDAGTFNYSTIIGSRAGGVQTSGDQNTYVGEEAGGAITTGSRNTIIGRYNGNAGGLDIRTASNYIVLSDGDGNPRLTFDNSGNLCTGGTTSNNFASAAGAIILNTGRGLFTASSNPPLAVSRLTSTGNLLDWYYGGSYLGSVSTNGSTITYGGTSDYRLKDNVAPLTGGLNKVLALKPCTFTWKNTGIKDDGFIAHELAEVCPNAVVGEKDAVNEDGSIRPQQIDTSFLVATLTAAIQELKSLVDAQATEIAELKAKVA